MDIGFGEALLLFGGLLAVAAALSGVMRGTVLSISVLSVALGIVLAATDVVDVDATDEAIVHLVELALILTLFSDGLFVERELLRAHWGPVGAGAGRSRCRSRWRCWRWRRRRSSPS